MIDSEEEPRPIEPTWEETIFANLIKKRISILKNYECSICQEGLIGFESVLSHYQKHFDDNATANDNIFIKCPTCFKQFENKPELNLHVNDYHKGCIFICAVCNKCFSKEDPFLCHMEQHRPNFEGFGSFKPDG